MKKKLPLKLLTVTQEELRDLNEVDSMVAHVQSGGKWTKKVLANYAKKNNIEPCPLIKIAYFSEDSRHVLHDGHHRVVSTYLAGRSFLYPNEYSLINRTYEAYDRVHLNENYVTPFDPREEVRLLDFIDFKHEALSLNGDTEEFVRQNRHRYAKSRTIWTVDELAKIYLEQKKQLEQV